MGPFTSTPFSSTSHTVSAKLFMSRTATYKGVRPYLSLSSTRPGLASTQCRICTSFIRQKENSSAAAAIL